MKHIILTLLIISFSKSILASTPKSCEGGEEEIHNMLNLLAKEAKDYYDENRRLPDSWSVEMTEITDAVPNSYKFGNINTTYDGQKIVITCSEVRSDGKYNHIHHYIDMKSLAISYGSDIQL